MLILPLGTKTQKHLCAAGPSVVFFTGEVVSVYDDLTYDTFTDASEMFGILSYIDGDVAEILVEKEVNLVTDRYAFGVNFIPGQDLTVNSAGLLTPCFNNRKIVGRVNKPVDAIGLDICFGVKNEYKSLVVKYGNGAVCMKCSEYFPYAEESNMPQGKFKCWGCRSGW